MGFYLNPGGGKLKISRNSEIILVGCSYNRESCKHCYVIERMAHRSNFFCKSPADVL